MYVYALALNTSYTNQGEGELCRVSIVYESRAVCLILAISEEFSVEGVFRDGKYDDLLEFSRVKTCFSNVFRLRQARGVSSAGAFSRVFSLYTDYRGQFGTGPNGSIEYKILTEDKIEDALCVQQKSMRQENVALGVGIYEEEGAAEAMKIVFREVIKDGCTVIAVDVNSDEVVGASFNKLHVPMGIDQVDPLLEVVKNHLKPRSSLALVNFLDDIESRVDMFERYSTNAAMEIFYVGTAPGYQGYKIGHGLVERSIQLAKSFVNYDQHANERTIVPGVAFGVFTSNYSQRIAAKLNFDWLEIIRYEDYECDGTKMSVRIGNVHQTAKLGALKL